MFCSGGHFITESSRIKLSTILHKNRISMRVFGDLEALVHRHDRIGSIFNKLNFLLKIGNDTIKKYLNDYHGNN